MSSASTSRSTAVGEPTGGAPPSAESGRRERSLDRSERRLLTVLGLPTFGMALSITVVSTYLPVVAKEFVANTTVIGVIIGSEGFMALFVPLIAGTWSDRLRTRLGGRVPFLLAGTPVMLIALVAMGFVASVVQMLFAVLGFFVAYFVAYEPYRALYPDLTPDEISGRAQSTQAVWRGAATGLALISGGVLLAVAQPVPFAVCAAILAAAIVLFVRAVVRRGFPDRDGGESAPPVGSAAREVRALITEHPALRAYLVANALWELTLGALKTFIVLYVTQGLGYSLRQSSLVIGAVAVIILVGAVASGKLADRFGTARVMGWSLWVYGLPMIVVIFTQTRWALGIAAVLIGLGGGVMMALPYALLSPLMPPREHGTLTGFYSLSRGIGVMLGPLLAGIAVNQLGGPFSSTHGYAAMWIVCAAGTLLSIPALARLRRRGADAAALHGA